VVFGCGGDRDGAKRPVMGKLAVDLADDVIITDDNPRTESAEKIVAEILAGIPNRDAVQVEHDRAKAILMALQRSAAGDVVLIAGKGHEDYQIYGTEHRAFSDQAIVRSFLGGASAGGRA
jgi:UDP-N-acetylmuramoyl-L-alanyl-D-glutamate--2,6-diaminopimelate ligase